MIEQIKAGLELLKTYRKYDFDVPQLSLIASLNEAGEVVFRWRAYYGNDVHYGVSIEDALAEASRQFERKHSVAAAGLDKAKEFIAAYQQLSSPKVAIESK